MDGTNAALCTRVSDHTLSLVTKRTYRLEHGKKCVLSDLQEEINKEPIFDERNAIVHDTDLVVYKLATDVVIKSRAWAPLGKAVKSLEIAVKVGTWEKKGVVFGDRHSYYKHGSIIFSEPESFVSIPIVYGNAYGGSDESARDELDFWGLEAIQQYLTFDISNVNLCVYRRNTIGKGYVIGEGDKIDGLALPNIEDPNDLLTPERLPVRNPKKWFYQPVPMGFDWFDYDWFPRSAYFGLTWGNREDVPGKDDPPIREITMNWVDEDIFKGKELIQSISEKVLNGASPGLVLPFLKGNEMISLKHMDPDYPEFTFELPGQIPVMELKPVEEDMKILEPRLYSVIVEKERNMVNLVWGGFVKTKYPHGPDQLKKVEFNVRW